MSKDASLQRFIDAQKDTYQTALTEITQGKKRSHWMWYIFPQIQGLGFSEISKIYAIKDLHEAELFLQHSLLRSRLVAICDALLALKAQDAHAIFGSPDDLKLKSSMTLFSSVDNSDPVFGMVLRKFFNGTKDAKTLGIIPPIPATRIKFFG